MDDLETLRAENVALRLRVADLERALQRFVSKPISQRRRFRIFERDGFRCTYCGRGSDVVTLQVDHVVPQCEGGDDRPDNLVTACHDCNNGKGEALLGRRPTRTGEVATYGPYPDGNRYRAVVVRDGKRTARTFKSEPAARQFLAAAR